MNEPRRGERQSLRNDNCGLAGRRSGPCGPRKKSRLFSKTLSSPAVLLPDDFSAVFVDSASLRNGEHSQICGPHWNPSVEKRLVLKNASDSNSEHFSTQAYGGPALSDRFFPRCCSRRFLGFSLYWSTGKFKKKRSSLLELRNLFRFRLYKRKIGLLIQNDPRRKSKKWSKDVVYVSSHFWLWPTHTHCNSMSKPKEWDDILSFCVSCHVRVAFQPNAYKKVRIACASGTLVPCQEQPAALITLRGAYNFCKHTWQIVHFSIITPTFYHQPKRTKNQTNNSENFCADQEANTNF